MALLMAAPVSWRRLLNSVYSASSPAVAGVFSRITDRLFRARDRGGGYADVRAGRCTRGPLYTRVPIYAQAGPIYQLVRPVSIQGVKRRL
uniref:Uncharacterized protein n=1 Tax=Periophthalmus magnuspinnatus TaxID=409849 RepID=A0A3B4AYN9_9GOBI